MIRITNYYELRRLAIQDIDVGISKAVPPAQIRLDISERYGFSGKIVDERIRQHLDAKASRKKGSQ